MNTTSASSPEPRAGDAPRPSGWVRWLWWVLLAATLIAVAAVAAHLLLREPVTIVREVEAAPDVELVRRLDQQRRLNEQLSARVDAAREALETFSCPPGARRKDGPAG